MYKLRFVFLLLGLATAASILTTCAPAPVDPLLGEHVAEGAATTEYLWVRNGAGAVVQFRRSDGARRVLAENGVVDMDRSRGRLLGLRAVEADGRTFQVLDLTGDTAISPNVALPSVPLALIADDHPTLVTEEALYRLSGGSWRRQKLSQSLRSPLHYDMEVRPVDASVALSGAGVIYVGFNLGEFGGGMYAIDPATGTVSEVTTALSPERAAFFAKHNLRLPPRLTLGTITDVARDIARPDCVLATEGLLHMGSASGELLRACGAAAEVIFRQPVELSDAKEFSPAFNTSGSGTWPLYSVGATREGWIALARSPYLFRSSRGVVSRREAPQLRNWRGVFLAPLSDDLIMLQGDRLVPVTR